MYILGIETSCDDTSLCVLIDNADANTIILAHRSFSAEMLLQKWGGVVPELAARNHLEKLAPLLKEVLAQAKISAGDLGMIGVTTNPGLLGPLLTGINVAKTLALFHKMPIVPVNHLYAHLEAIHLTQYVPYPYLGLLVSGGHSIFFRVEAADRFIVLGTTIDDAAGEAFDKGGKLLGLGYPAGKIIDQYAEGANHLRFSFPIGLEHSKNATLSFSGLKTSLRHFLQTHPQAAQCILQSQDGEQVPSPDLADLCASYQWAIIRALKLKLKYALLASGDEKMPIVVGGGVACNRALRQELSATYSNIHFVQSELCTDNGAMIANFAARTRQLALAFPDCLKLDAQDRFFNKRTAVHKQI